MTQTLLQASSFSKSSRRRTTTTTTTTAGRTAVPSSRCSSSVCCFATPTTALGVSIGISLLPTTPQRKRNHHCSPRQRHHYHTAPYCLIPPKKYQLPLSDHERGPPKYKWNPNFPGTLKPGTVEDNFPLERVLKSDVYKNMVYDEFDMDERVAEIVEPDEDLLEWLDRNNRLIPHDAPTDDFDLDSDPQMTVLTEDDLNYADDDSKMIEYYSKQSEGAQTGTSLDFGGFSDSGSRDYDAGF